MNYELLQQLTQEQLIHLIKKCNESNTIISEICVEESKCHIKPKQAVDEISDALIDLDLPMFDHEIEGFKAEIDFEMGKITAEECRRIKLGI